MMRSFALWAERHAKRDSEGKKSNDCIKERTVTLLPDRVGRLCHRLHTI
ncbi:MAG: hypothetical protein IKL21_07800 [Clostridia bacterium]|nr:hypothetical protein [Clostridia bacterium]